MAIVKFGRHGKRPYRFYLKVTLVVFLGLGFFVFWSSFSSPSSSVLSQRGTFSDISADKKGKDIRVQRKSPATSRDAVPEEAKKRVDDNVNGNANAGGREEKNEGGGSVADAVEKNDKKEAGEMPDQKEGEVGESEKEKEREIDNEEEIEEVEDRDKEIDGESDSNGDSNDTEKEQESIEEKVEDENGDSIRTRKEKKKMGPLFDTKTHHSWKLCRIRSGHNYVPCIDIEGAIGKLQSYRHRERSCPKSPPTCLVPLPEGYGSLVHWPESKSKILYRNVGHPKLAAFIKSQSWLSMSNEYLTFPQNQSVLKGGALHYIDSIEEMAPDIEWGKNIRNVLDIGCTDASFGAALLEKEVLTLSLGLKDDQADLAQVVLERGFPAVIDTMATRRLPFPSAAFDAIHCGGCSIHWHANDGKLLLEMNRILRPGGYFVSSTNHGDIEKEEAMSTLMASICWNILAHKTDEISDVGIKIYQKPASNEIYELRRRKNPPMCKEDENPDAAWYAPMKICLHPIPASVEQHGTDWPEEWPQRLETFPDWVSNRRESLIADSERWKDIVNKSYLNSMGIDWSNVRNIMDMKAVHGGFAAALASQNVWVMNVIPTNAPDTLPIIYERGLLGIYHDWCESFSTYPRSYNLLHADHLFSRLKNRCKQPLGIVVEMDRILRPGGWAIIRDKVEILDPLESILRTLHWEIRMTYSKEKEGLLCAQKTMWRP